MTQVAGAAAVTVTGFTEQKRAALYTYLLALQGEGMAIWQNEAELAADRDLAYFGPRIQGLALEGLDALERDDVSGALAFAAQTHRLRAEAVIAVYGQ